MPYTGNSTRLTQTPNARTLPGPSQRHGTNEGDPSLSRGEHSIPAGTGGEYQGSDFERVVMQGHGMPLDNPSSWAVEPPGGPYESPYAIQYSQGNPHDSQAVLSARGAYAQTCDPRGQYLRTDAHDGQPDRGYMRTLYGAEPFADHTQLQDALSIEGLNSSVAQPEGDGGKKYGRGINSLPENNPDRIGYTNGFRPGIDRVRVWEGDAAHHVTRDLTPQMLQLRDNYVPNHYPRMFADVVTQPQLPRDAPNMDDAIMSNSVYATAPASVFGGF
jgi:hypothetical protein